MHIAAVGRNQTDSEMASNDSKETANEEKMASNESRETTNEEENGFQRIKGNNEWGGICLQEIL